MTSDADLVRSYLTGDPSAFEELVRRHEQRTYNLALRMLGRSEDARDATQDTFLTALRKLDTFRGDAAFTTWLHRVTVNACYDMMRKKARQPMLHVVSDDEGREVEPGPPVPDHADVVAGDTDVGRALARVPIEYRAVLVLHDVQDIAVEEVAKILDVPSGTVKSRLHRGRIALARELGLRPPHGERANAPGTSQEEP